MTCNHYAEALDLAPSRDSIDPHFREALDHARTCQVCGARLSRRLAAENSIRMKMEMMAVMPESLPHAILEKTRRASMTARQTRRRWMAMAASLLAAVTLSAPAYHFWNKQKEEEAVRRLCVLSIRNHELTHTPELLSENGEAISRWLSNRMNRLVRLPAGLAMTSIKGARRCALAEHIVAAVQFEISGKRSTLFAFYPDEFGIGGFSEPPKPEMGYTVAVWSEQGIGYSLVSEAPAEEVAVQFRPASGFKKET